MNHQDEQLKNAFEVLNQESVPTQQRKDIMLERILTNGAQEKMSGFNRWKNLIVTYPWRAAFVLSVVQAVIFTMIFGSQYTNLFLNYFGG